MRKLLAMLGATVCGLALTASPAAAQTVAETVSSGERSDTIFTSEIGQGSVTYTGAVHAEINGQPVDLALTLPSRFQFAYTPAEVAALLPSTYVQDVGGVAVTITGWSAPELTESFEELVGYFHSESHTSSILTETSIQLTSGDGPGAEVPTGFRGFCSDAGVSGETNFGAFDGSFANCEGAEFYQEVAPGTINRNSHSTTLYLEEFHTFEIFDYAYNDQYLIRPSASQSWSAGTLSQVEEIARTVRTDSYRTGYLGMLGETVLFEQSADGRADGAAAQALLADLSRPMAHQLAGAPVIVTWSDPRLVQSSEVLTSSSVDVSTTNASSSIVTVTTTLGQGSGETVLIGNRGNCTTTGTSDLAAQCDGGVAYSLATGELNTNTHTTQVSQDTIVTTTTENWLTAQTFALIGTATAIGQIHAAIADTLFDDGRSIATLQSAMLRGRSGLGFGLWVQGFTGGGSRDDRRGAPGWTSDREGLAGGASFALSGVATVGLSASHATSDIVLNGSGDNAEINQTQIALGAEFSPGIWQLQLAAGAGWSEIDTRRGTAALGGTSTASYDATTRFAAARAGPEFGLGPVSLRPYLGLDWTRAKIDGFTETGGIALLAPDETRSRTEVKLGAELAAEIDVPGGWGLRLEADAAGGSSTGDNARTRTVAFAATPANALMVTAARAPGSFAEGRLGATLQSPLGIALHLAGGGRLAAGNDDWQVSAGLSFRF